jgi:hypothetical protein
MLKCCIMSNTLRSSNLEFLDTKVSLKEDNHQHVLNVYCYIQYRNLLHVSTPPGHLQGEEFLYTMAALIELNENVPLT